MKMCCVFSLESPHRGDSNEYTKHTIININKKSPEIILNTIISAAIDFLLGTQEGVQRSRDKLAISVRATEILLYIKCTNTSSLWTIDIWLIKRKMSYHIGCGNA